MFGPEPPPTGGGDRAFVFGPYRLIAAQRLLLEGDKPVRLGGRAFDILVALVERAGEVVEKDELITRAWPETSVEDANLKIQVSALRRALGDGQGGHRYVATVIGRGYNFVAPVRLAEPSSISPPPTIAAPVSHNLPIAVTRMIGREDAVAAILARLSDHRQVTVVGPGGVGKTTVALAVAEHAVVSSKQSVWLVDLTSLGDARLVPSAIATALGLEIRQEGPLGGLIAALRDRRMLLLLDNCERFIDATASVVAAVLSGTSGVNILATSREPLRIAGERQYRLRPLASPMPSSTLTAALAIAFPAVQLFAERVAAVVEDFALTDANVPHVVEACRRLDGLPLAIEFAASRVAVLGVEGLVANLDDSLPLLVARRRSATPRHRTMRAVVDWSYNLLTKDEQHLLRAIGIFAGGFAVEAAAAVAMDAATAGVDAIDRLADLVAKSLVVADVSGAKPRFRLLDTTRAYALEKLDTSGERKAIAGRHAEYYRQFIAHAEAEALAQTIGDWLANYVTEIDNLRAALDWAFAPGGDAATGVALTAAAVPIWLRLSQLEECRGRARQALGALETASREDPEANMRLHAALGASTSDASEMVAAFSKALDVAKELGNREYQLRALWGLYFFHTGSGRFRAAHAHAQEFYTLTLRGSDRTDLMFGEHAMGVAEHFVGDQMSARRHLEQALALDARGILGANLSRFGDVVRFGIDSRLSAQVFLARLLWLLGFADQAVQMVERSLGEAEASGHAISQCFVLAMAACPIAFWVGDGVAAARYTVMLVDLSRQHVLPHWAAFGARYERVVAVRAGNASGGSPRRLSGQEERAEPDFSFRSLTGLTQLVEALGDVGRIAEGLVLLEGGIEQFEANCFLPELVRLKCELSLLKGTPDAQGSAETGFRQALDLAREHGALSWELRAATSLARLLRDQDRPAAAAASLRPIYDRFTEGFSTADLTAAKRLLDELDAVGHL